MFEWSFMCNSNFNLLQGKITSKKFNVLIVIKIATYPIVTINSELQKRQQQNNIQLVSNLSIQRTINKHQDILLFDALNAFDNNLQVYLSLTLASNVFPRTLLIHKIRFGLS